MPILARVLRDRGIVTEKQLAEAIQHQVLYGGRLGTSLYELGMISEDTLQQALARAHGVRAGVVEPGQVEPGAVRLLPRALAEKHKVCPYKVKGRTLQLLMVDPGDHASLARIGFSLGYILKPLVVPEFRMLQLLQQHYGIDDRWRYQDSRRAASPAVAPLSPERGALDLDRAATRDEVVATVLGVCLGQFRRVVFFIVREPWLVGWRAAGQGVEPGLAARLRIPLDRPSALRNVTRDNTVFLGRLGPDPQSQDLLKALGRKPNSSAALLPIAVKGRVVNLVYADGGVSAPGRPNLGELMVVMQKVPRAYLRIIRRRIEEAGGELPRPEQEKIRE